MIIESEEFMIVSNLTRYRIARQVLEVIIAGDNFGVCKDTHRKIISDIKGVIDHLEDMID